MDSLQTLQKLFTDSEGKRFTVAFSDDDCRDLVIVSDSHVLLNDTVWGVPLTPDGEEARTEPGIEFNLHDVKRVHDFNTKHLLFGAA